MRWFRQKMPDAILRRYKIKDGSYAYADLVCTFMADGRRWCKFRDRLFLLKDDGTAIGDNDSADCVWEKL